MASCLQEKIKEIKALRMRNIWTGERLSRRLKDVPSEKRAVYTELEDYLLGPEQGRVCILFGLRRTGKTTLLCQAMADLLSRQDGKCAYILAENRDTMAALTSTLDHLEQEGCEYVFLDEATRISDFSGSTGLLADVYCRSGMKIILSGTDSLMLAFACEDELYDKARLIHTTHLPFEDFSRITAVPDVADYIRAGGVFPELSRFGGIRGSVFDSHAASDAYIDMSIAQNIQHSLELDEVRDRFHHLYDLYRAGELTGAINRIVHNASRRFVLEVLTDRFRNADLSLARKNIASLMAAKRQPNPFDLLDRAIVEARVAERLLIRDPAEMKVKVGPEHLAEIEMYLRQLEIVDFYENRLLLPNTVTTREVYCITMPGMRYCQAEALVHEIFQDPAISELDAESRELMREAVLRHVAGAILEELVIYETKRRAIARHEVFKLGFGSGEFDMVIYNEKEHCCALFELKYATQASASQARHLLNEEYCRKTEARYGEIVTQTVLYRGENLEGEDGVLWQNVEEYLRDLAVNFPSPVANGHALQPGR